MTCEVGVMCAQGSLGLFYEMTSPEQSNTETHKPRSGSIQRIFPLVAFQEVLGSARRVRTVAAVVFARQLVLVVSLPRVCASASVSESEWVQ